MREPEYRGWLEQQQYPVSTIQSRMANVRRVKEYHGSLDAAFDQDGLRSLIDLFKYTAEDKRRGKDNPTKIPINGNYCTNLAMYKNAIGLYQKFRQETANGFQPVREEDTPAPPALLLQEKKLIGLERDMQVLLRRDLEQLESGLVIDDDGAERQVNSGRIDITAKDANGSLVVIELKIGRAGREAVGQILGYMGDIVEEEGTVPVRGILVADSFDQGALSAVRMVAGLSLKKYSVSFQFSDENK